MEQLQASQALPLVKALGLERRLETAVFIISLVVYSFFPRTLCMGYFAMKEI